MIQYFILIIIIIVCIEVYFRFNSPLEKLEDIIIINKPSENNIDENNINEPWDKIKKYNNSVKYYIKINNINKKKINDWNNIIKYNIDIDTNKKYIIILSDTEEEALAIANLFLSYINNEIDLDEIVDNNLIELSIRKAKTHSLVKIKLKELIKEGVKEYNSNIDNLNKTLKYYDTTNDTFTNNIMVNEFSHFGSPSDIIDDKISQDKDILSTFDSIEQDNISSNLQNNRMKEDIDIKEKSNEMMLNKVDEQIVYDIKPIEKLQLKDSATPFSSNISAFGGSEYAMISF